MVFFLVSMLSVGSLFSDPEDVSATPVPVENVIPEYVVSSGDGMAALSEQLLQLQSDVAALSDEDARSVYQQAAQATLSSTLIDVMQRVLQGHPFCDYVAFRDSFDDTTSGILVYGNRSEVSGNSIFFPAAKLVRYYRTGGSYGSSYIYNYTVQDVSDYQVNFNGSTLLYTNILDGYPALVPDYRQYLIYIFVGAVILFVILISRRNK